MSLTNNNKYCKYYCVVLSSFGETDHLTQSISFKTGLRPITHYTHIFMLSSIHVFYYTRTMQEKKTRTRLQENMKKSKSVLEKHSAFRAAYSTQTCTDSCMHVQCKQHMQASPVNMKPCYNICHPPVIFPNKV